MPIASAARMAPKPDGVEFTFSSSLPPMVAGPVTGEVELLVPYFYPKPGVLCSTRYLRDGQREPLFVVRLQWWGDGGPGTVLKPELLNIPDERRERIRCARVSKATCALFPVRCGAEGLAVYLEDMGTITLDVLVHEGEARGARLVGRCVVPVDGWGSQPATPEGPRQSNVVPEGYFSVMSINGNKHAGNLGVRLRVCLGQQSNLRGMLATAKMTAHGAHIDRETRDIVRVLEGDGVACLTETDDAVGRGYGRQQQGSVPAPNEHRVVAEGSCDDVIPARASFDSESLTVADDSSEASAIAGAKERFHRQLAQVSSFQLNEALAAFDASDTLPVWPTPISALYRAPEMQGEPVPMPRDYKALRGRVAAGANVGGRWKIPLISTKPSGVGSNKPPVRVGISLTEGTRMSEIIGDTRPQSGSRNFTPITTSISPEQQAPNPNPDSAATASSPYCGGEEEGRVQALPLKAEKHMPLHLYATDAAATRHDKGLSGLSELFNRGKELRDKMTMIAEKPTQPPPFAITTAYLPFEASPPPAGAEAFSDLFIGARPGILSSKPGGFTMRNGIEGIFDVLSDGGSDAEQDGVLIRDPQTRGHEKRVVDLLLEAAGPPPSSLAFPALAAIERRRADALACARFLRIRLSRLVMFGSMTSSPEGHGWQLRFRLPAFAAPPARGSIMGNTTVGCGKVVSFPVPPRVSSASRGRRKAARRERSAPGPAGTVSSSVLRVRRGFGASDLAVGETPLLEEVVCAVDVNDGCVRQWMDASLEFLLVDGKTEGGPRSKAGQRNSKMPLRKEQQQRVQSSTIDSNDRIVAVASLPLRDLLLSADLGVVATLDLTEVSDFWAAEDARMAAKGVRGRLGRPLRNPYRDAGTTGARPLVLGNRAVGALAVSLELVPGEDAHVSSEQSRPEIERGFDRRRGGSMRQTVSSARDLELEWPTRSGNDGDVDDGLRNATARSTRPLSPVVPIMVKPLAFGVPEFPAVSKMDVAVRPPVVARREENPMQKEIDDDSRPAPLVVPSAGVVDATVMHSSVDETHSPLVADCVVMLRLLGLTMAPATGSDIKSVRVAYSFTQVEMDIPSATHCSARGFRKQEPNGKTGDGQTIPTFVFHHQEVFPAPAETTKMRRSWTGASASRVFEVWGSAVGPADRVEGPEEVLLGLAKISLNPFSMLDSDRGARRAGLGAGAGAGSLLVAADGPVVVTDPFSGRAIGELCVLLVLGPTAEIAALPPGGADPGEVDHGASVSERAGLSATVDEKCEGKEDDREEGDEASARYSEVGGKREAEEGSDCSSGDTGVPQEASGLDDSVAELSMLLNPGRAEKSESASASASASTEEVQETRRIGGGFTGLVRHVLELSAVGEVPLALDVGILGQDGIDEPLGCTIEYYLPPGGEASLDVHEGDVRKSVGAGQRHELWWDADSGILNSRARHTIKVPDREAATTGTGPPADRSFARLLDCMLGQEDVVLSLSWSVGGATGQRVPWDRDGEGVASSAEANGLTLKLGNAVLRRDDLLPLVRQTSANAVLRIPIEPSRGEKGGDEGAAPPAPKTLPLSVSYRREPSAVARRNSRGWSGRAFRRATVGDLARDREDEKRQGGVSAPSPDSESVHENRAGESDVAGSPWRAEPSGKTEEYGGVCPRMEEEKNAAEFLGNKSPPDPRGSNTLAHGSTSNKSLLPACAAVYVTVETLDLAAAPADSEDDLVWASFEFPGSEHRGASGERRRGGVFVWRPEGGNQGGLQIHWSPPVATARRDEGLDRASLAWRVECPVKIDAAFVEYVHTQSLELRVWSGRRWLWPKGGKARGVAKVALRPLLMELGGIRGDATLFPREGLDGRAGSVTIHLSFTHGGLGSDGDAAVNQVADCTNVDGYNRDGGDNGEKRETVEAGEESALPRVSSAFEAVMAKIPASESAAERNQSNISPPRSRGRSLETLTEGSDGGKLVVHVEQAMRLRSSVFQEVAPGVPEAKGSPPSPSTYVSFRWEEAGKPPLFPILTLEATRPEGTEQDKSHGWQCGQVVDEEATTPVVENTSSPVFNHTTELRAVGAGAMNRVCGPSAALVFRVWRCARRYRWDAPRTEHDQPADPKRTTNGGNGSDQLAQEAKRGITKNTATPQLGDKLIGSAVVGLEVLRGAIGDHEDGGPGLREIDGWYHVLDDLQRPQGQIKVRVIPQPREPAREPQPGCSEHPSTATTLWSTGDTGVAPPVPGAHGPLPLLAAASDTRYQSLARVDTPPPLYDTQTHLRTVYALLESLPAEFRLDQPRHPQLPPPSSETRVPVHDDVVVFSPQSEVEPQTPLRSSSLTKPEIFEGEAEEGLAGEPSSLPELRRMLLSLDKVDKRLFALNPSDGDPAPPDHTDNEDIVVGLGGVDGLTLDLPIGTDVIGETRAASPNADRRGHGAVSRLQRAWRAWSRRKQGAKALAQAEREAYFRRQSRREDAAVIIQSAHRRYQARHRARAAAEERRRWRSGQLRRTAACVTLERAWRAFEGRRRASRELVEKQVRAAATVEEEQRAEAAARAAAIVQAAWRGALARAAARRLRMARARTTRVRGESAYRGGIATTADGTELATARDTLKPVPPSDVGVPSVESAPLSSRSLPFTLPLTFYNQLSQTSSRRIRLSDVHANIAVTKSAAASNAGLSSIHSPASSEVPVANGRVQETREQLGQSRCFGPLPKTRLSGAVRPLRFADLETARIARIMKVNLQNRAGHEGLRSSLGESSSSLEEFGW